MNDADAQRRAAGERAAAMVEDGMVIGYGTGRAANAALDALAARVRAGMRLSGVPTSEMTRQHCLSLGLPLTTLDEHPRLDLVIDGADEVDPSLQLLKGGGAAHTREKLVALAARKRLIVVEQAKLVRRLGETRGVPIEVLSFGWKTTLHRIESVLPGVKRREGKDSDNHAFIADAPLPVDANLREIDRAIKGMAGVIDHGLFLDMEPTVIVGEPDGVRVLT